MAYKRFRIAIAILCTVALCTGVVVAFTDASEVSHAIGETPDPSPAAPSAPKRGDLNGDGALNSADARLLWRYLDQGYPLTEEQLALADLTDNGLVNTVDARFLWQAMLLKPDESAVVPTTQPAVSGGTTASSTRTDATTATTTAATTTTTTKATTTTTKAPTTAATTKAPTTAAPPSPQATVQVAPLPSMSTPPSVSLAKSNVDESVYMKCIRIRAGSVTYDGSTKEGLQLGIAADVKCELGASKSAMYSTEAWKAQAVVSYTHIARTCYEQVVNNGNTGFVFGLAASNAINLNDANDRRIYNAVGEVLGQKMMIPSAGGNFAKLCYGFYSASVAGTTASCHKVYVANLPYAQAVYSPETDALVRKYTGQTTAYIRTYTYTIDELMSEVSDYLGETIYRETRPDAFALYTTEWDGGYMYRSNLYYLDRYGNRVYVKGTAIKAVMGVRSHGISVIAQKGNTMTIQVTGNGHGVGFSQLGAVVFANEYGWTYDQIVAHYFSITPNSAHQLCLPKW